MVFSSPLFLFCFLPATLFFYWISGKRWRNLTLIAASFVFYALGDGIYLFLMLFSTVLNHGFAKILHRQAQSESSRKVALAAAVFMNIGFLAIFKYAAFLSTLFNDLTGAQLAVPQVHMPVGISFYTFQAMSFVIDVYRRKETPQGLSSTILYITLFPQLIAGPIVRFGDVARDIRSRVIRLDGYAEGLRRFVIGLGKKVLIANTLAGPADQVFAASASDLSLPAAWFGLICYALQIYFDFSGYSDMGIGMGKMLGFTFPENFNLPYISRSMSDFWRRWHLTLSTWFRDYLYVPLGGNRKGTLRTAFNLLIVFFLCGLWHGASLNFACWGLYHGAFLAFEKTRLGQIVSRLPRFLGHLYALLVILGGWVLFRADSLTHAAAYTKMLFFTAKATMPLISLSTLCSPEIALVFAAALLAASGLVTWNRVGESRSGEFGFGGYLACGAELTFLAFIFVASAASLAAGNYNPFIYYRF